uniref:Thioredoxin domain-containing protein n=1 Tax=Scylla olivacea TaxID=85551 RepID=A0A0P4WMG4_SCYOL
MAVTVRSARRVLLPIFLISIFARLSPVTCTNNQLEVMQEQELRQFIIDEDYVVVLFSNAGDCTGRCEELEDTLASIREDVVEALNAWVVRTYSPTLSTEYGLNTKKTGDIIFVRKGVPLLYSGPADDDEYLLHYLITNPESSIHTLTDVNFEHLTQAATGATTGDWLVMFVRADCDSCVQLQSTVEAVAAVLKNKKNVAVVDRDDQGGQTTRRFGVKTFPSFILFRQGRLYRYMLPAVDATTLEHFASDGFRNARAESVPHPKTPFDDFTEWCADWLRENPEKAYLGLGILAVVVAGAVFFCVQSSRQAAATANKKANKKKK